MSSCTSPDMSNSYLDKGRYHLGMCLGAGSFGTVYHAVDVLTPRLSQTYFCGGGDLLTVIGAGAFMYDEKLIRSTFTQILDAVAHLSRSRQNILYSMDGLKVLLADFGLSTEDA
ncbi:uncharacterized protein EV420DRAFT_1547416, partial [Desarmillaria tabescens]